MPVETFKEKNYFSIKVFSILLKVYVLKTFEA